MIRALDIMFSLFGLIFGLPVFFIILVLATFDLGSPVFKQKRMGQNKAPFTLYKFRTMSKDTASMASHLITSSSITSFGRFLRKKKIR